MAGDGHQEKDLVPGPVTVPLLTLPRLGHSRQGAHACARGCARTPAPARESELGRVRADDLTGRLERGRLVPARQRADRAAERIAGKNPYRIQSRAAAAQHLKATRPAEALAPAAAERAGRASSSRSGRWRCHPRPPDRSSRQVGFLRSASATVGIQADLPRRVRREVLELNLRSVHLREGRAAWMAPALGAVIGLALTLATLALSPSPDGNQGAESDFDLAPLANLHALSIGLLGLIAGLCLEIVLRLDVRSSIEVALDALPPSRRAAVSELLVKSLNHLSTTIRNYSDDFQEAAMSSLRDCEAELAEFASGRRYTLPSPGWLESRLASAKESLHAVTDGGDIDWWRSPDRGRPFFEAHRPKIEKGFRVERVFLVTSENRNEMQQLVTEHKGIGVRCYIVDVGSCPEDLCDNITIFDARNPDTRAMHRDYLGRNGQTRKHLHSENEADIAAALGAFERLKARGSLA